jgi:hypothetical protein
MRAKATLPPPNASDSNGMIPTQPSNFSNTLTPPPDPNIQKPMQLQPGQQQAPPAGPTKAHKLMTILQAGLQGALAGRAASEQAVAASGGHLSGGVGTGFEAGYMLPWQRAMQAQELEQAKAKTALTQAQSQMIDIPGFGPVPAAIAKAIFPAQIGAEAKRDVAKTGAEAHVQGAELGKEGRTQAADIAGQYRMKALAAGTAPITQEDIQQYNLPPEFLGKVIKPSEIGGLQRAQNSNLVTVQGAQGPALVNKAKQTTKNLGLGSPGVAVALARPREVADVDNPGQTTTVSGGEAIAKRAPGVQSASVQVPRAAMKAEVPTKIGDQKVAFNTMLSHADLLRNAAKAMNNGNVRALANIKNTLKTEFGDADYTNLEAIVNAYNHEVTSVIAKGHIDDTEVKKGERTLPLNANYATIDKVLNSYQALAKSKMDMLTKQEQAAVSSSQKGGGKTGGGSSNEKDPLGIR